MVFFKDLHFLDGDQVRNSNRVAVGARTDGYRTVKSDQILAVASTVDVKTSQASTEVERRQGTGGAGDASLGQRQVHRVAAIQREVLGLVVSDDPAQRCAIGLH